METTSLNNWLPLLHPMLSNIEELEEGCEKTPLRSLVIRGCDPMAVLVIGYKEEDKADLYVLMVL